MTTTAVVLAAGKGTRLKSATPKVLHTASGRSLLGWVLAAIAPLELERVVVVVGHQAERVAEEARRLAAEVGLTAPVIVEQAEQNGTGHAVRMVAEAGALDDAEEVLVLPGDVPAIQPDSLRRLRAARSGAMAVMTARLGDPTGYGRIVRGEDGRVTAIVEHRDATVAQRAIDEVNTGLFVYDAEALRRSLMQLTTDNDQGEEYLTDTLALLVPDGVDAIAVPAEQVDGINDRAQLAAVADTLRRRLLTDLMVSGVTVVDPATTYVDPTVRIDADATILPGTMLHGATTVAAGATLGPHSRLTDTVVGKGATVTFTVATGAEIGPRAVVGPFAHLRPGTVLRRAAKAGGFVEMKNAVIGEGSKVPHLSYIGDAELGESVNIGAGTITCNYDGYDKHRTVVRDGAFVGSDTMLVAPIEIGSGAYIGAGSTVTRDVPADALVVERADARVMPGWAARWRRRHET